MMSSESSSGRKARARPAAGKPEADTTASPSSTPLRVLDWILIGAFLGLTFLLGVFPLKDTDFWWHLRTGDWIRQTGQVPTHDLYTFTVPDHRWIDLHWGFQVLVSWAYQHGGIVSLNLAKCVVTCAAVFLLVTARKPGWPVWAILLAWLPALLVLSGRMYLRPETLSLLYLSAFLAILFRLEKTPRMAWLLPVVQVLWVNTQGLFVLGPVILVFFLIAEVLRPGTLAPGRRAWWRTVLIGVALTGVACFLNPYGWLGAVYPLELARTMGNPVFSQSIAELTPLDQFIRRNMGWNNLPLRLHVATMVLGALSFLVPLVWGVAVRFSRRAAIRPDPVDTAARAGAGRRGKAKARTPSKPAATTAARTQGEGHEPAWPRLLFRLFLFAAFSVLSWQATRNSHQFAAVVGTVTAWNFGEWAAAVGRRRRPRPEPSEVPNVAPRLATLAAILIVGLAVGSGWFYTLAGEGRTIGLGEEPLWFPHEAVKFAGRLGMPERFLGYHDGYAALYEYHNGPERKVFADARLEVIGPELYERYLDLQRLLIENHESWRGELDSLGRPAVLLGHADSAVAGVSLLASPHWKCVWFDPMVALYVHDAYRGVVQTYEVDFAARHFRSDPATRPRSVPALLASAKALWTYGLGAQERRRADLARPMILLGLDYAWRIQQAEPARPAGWKLIGQLESAREGPSDSKTKVPRYRFPFDPVFDLSSVRTTHALRRALEAAPDDFMTLWMLAMQFSERGMNEAALPLFERLLRLRPINDKQAMLQASVLSTLDSLRERAAAPVPTTWENLSDLDRIVASLLAAGRAGSAADILERAYPSQARPWEVTDRIATLRLHLGEPRQARELWERGAAPPRPAVRAARVAVTQLVEGAFEEARRLYLQAAGEDPELFEAQYGLAVLQEDTGRAGDALHAARAAVKLAPSEVARAAAAVIVNETTPFAGP